jgi:hypothetical protein
MSELRTVAWAFVEMANRMVYCTLATVDRRGRPRSRIVHTLWELSSKPSLSPAGLWLGTV